jgi:hypothetical protein
MSALWYVKLPDGDVEPLTLDELDEAFQAGHINSNTMVLAAGATQWERLGQLAGLEQPAAVAQPLPLPQPLPYQQHRVHVAYTPTPNSLRPVSVDLGDYGDEDTSFPKPKKSKKWVVGVALVAGVLGFAAFQAQRSGVISVDRLLSGVSPAAAAAPAPAPQPVTPPAPAPEVTNPVAATASAAPAVTAVGNPLTDPAARLTQEQKDKLAAADKQLAAKTKAHTKVHGGGSVSVHTPAKSKAMGFTTGGNKFDPLNATIP